ncbi:unnamed protein product, partial [Musa banksii]
IGIDCWWSTWPSSGYRSHLCCKIGVKNYGCKIWLFHACTSIEVLEIEISWCT